MPPSTIARRGIAATLTLVSACGGGERPAVTLIGGVPATTDLQLATGLPQGSIYSVIRGAESWRVLYHASAGPPEGIAARLCRLEGRIPATIRPEPIAGAEQLPGARKITITCRG